MPEETKLEAPQPETKEAAPPVLPVQDGAKAPEVTVDGLKAELEATRETAKKLERDLKALRGARVSQEERDARLEDIQADFKAMRETQTKLLGALTQGWVETLPDEVKKIEAEDTERTQKVIQERGSRSFTAVHNRLLGELQGLVTGDDGKPILDLNESPEMEGVRETWGRAFNAKDIGGLAEALNEAHKVMRRLERAQLKEAAKKAAEERVDKAVKQKLDQAAVHDLDTGGGAGGGGVPPLATLVKKDTRRMSPVELQEHDKNLDAAMRRGR